MKKILEIALGIVTSVGGFLEIGSITTAAQAGADFSFQLTWAIALGGLCIIFLVEQAGRFAAAGGPCLVFHKLTHPSRPLSGKIVRVQMAKACIDAAGAEALRVCGLSNCRRKVSTLVGTSVVHATKSCIRS